MVVRLVMLGKRYNEELTIVLAGLCLSQLSSIAGTPLHPDLLVGGSVVFVTCFAPTITSFVTQSPRTILGSYVQMKYGSVGAGWRTLSVGSLQGNSLWNSGTILSPLPLFLLLLLPLTFSVLPGNEEWAPEEAHTSCPAAANNCWHLVFHTST